MSTDRFKEMANPPLPKSYLKFRGGASLDKAITEFLRRKAGYTKPIGTWENEK